MKIMTIILYVKILQNLFTPSFAPEKDFTFGMLGRW